MKHLGTLTGMGTLLLGEQQFEGIEYRVDVWLHTRGAKSGSGTLQGDINALDAAFNANEVVLQLKDGNSVKVIVTRISGGRTEIKTSGPVPGF